MPAEAMKRTFPKKTEAKRTVTVKKEVKVDLPDLPKVKEGEIAMRLIYRDGQSKDFVGHDMCGCIEAAKKYSRSIGKSFFSPDHVEAWDRVV